ncbi:MAG: helix-turn-helix transcriptional regulator [Hyphomicrobiales bacterium]
MNKAATFAEFGRRVRRRREDLDIGLRELARRVALSPAYLSMVERGELPPPAEEKVVALARELKFDADELLASAGRVSDKVAELVRTHADELPELIRQWPKLPAEQRRTILASAKARSSLRATAEKK